MTFYDFTKRNGAPADRSFFYKTLMSKLKKFSYMDRFDTVEKRRAVVHKVMADQQFLRWRRGQVAWSVADEVVLEALAGQWR